MFDWARNRVTHISWFVLLLVSLSSCYTIQQGFVQNGLFNAREKIAAVLRDPNLETAVRVQLLEVQRILKFAAANGLHTRGAYEYYIHTDEPVVSHLVQAAEPFKLKSKTWWFPIVGSVPYLGFFDRNERDAMAAELSGQGLDVYKSGVGAFSSLGWFEDPIYTSMLRRDRADLAHLLFHELTHRTYWSPGSVRFNENLAEYVGEQLTEAYLGQLEGGEAELSAYQDKREDRLKFKEWLKELREALDRLYNKPPVQEEELRQAKEAIFQEFTGGVKQPKLVRSAGVFRGEWNNARVLANSLYAPDTARFAKAHKCVDPSQAVRTLFEALEDIESDFDDQFDALDALCK